MIYKFIDTNGSEISVNSLSSLQALVDSETIKENTKVKAGLRGKWTTASNIEDLVFEVKKTNEREEIQEPEEDIKSFITKDDKPEETKIAEQIEETVNSDKPEETKIAEKTEEDIVEPWKNEKVVDVLETSDQQPEAVKEKSEYELEEEKRDKTYDDENVVGLNFFQAIQTCLKKYFIIKGRASRSEYWYFQLLFSPIAFYAGFWSDPVSTGMIDPPPLYLISLALVVLLFIPAITSQVRRFHDKDKSGWFILINLIPFVGWIIVLVICIDKGTAGKNRFGEYPLKANNKK
ncbi:DUF805 domain-containing protein [Candidatus Pelagibacter sp.]|nr:DUF805 domain-containing protein [Candidatus Pelagibacter sp.]